MSSTPEQPRGPVPDDEPDRPEARAARVGVAVQSWQHELSLVGGPNTLLWHRDLPTGTLDLTTAHPGGVAMLLAGRPTRLSDLVRESAALEEARRRVRSIRRKTVELWEEHGLVTGYIAVGMATWDVLHAPRPPAAPVLLRRCTLRPTGAAELDYDVDLGADVEFNPVLQHYLRSERGIDLDGVGLAERALVRKGFDPHPVYAELARECRSVRGFRISPRLVVGTFSHDKLSMVADLAAQGERLAGHDVVAALAGDPGAEAAVARALPDPPADPDPGTELTVLDLDSSQQAAVEAARTGASLVVEGAPGTGKTQTVAGLVAALAGDGQRVLLVSEKRAGIEAVRSRLDAVGLGDLVWTDRDDPQSRRRVAADLVAALDARLAPAQADDTSAHGGVDDAVPDEAQGAAAEDEGETGALAETEGPGDAEGADPADRAGHTDTEGRDGHEAAVAHEDPETRLLRARDELAAHLATLHDNREPWGVSAFDAQVALAAFAARPAAPVSRVRLTGSDLEGLSRDRVDQLGARLTEAARLGAWTSGDEEDPWYASRFGSEEEAEQALEITSRLGGGEVESAHRAMADLAEEAGLPVPATVGDWDETLTLMEQVRDTLEVFRLDVFDAPLSELVAATTSRDQRRTGEVELGVFARSRLTRQARSLLRPGPPPADLHGELERALRERDRWRELGGSGSRPQAPAGIESARAQLDPVLRDVQWLGERLEQTASGNDLARLDLEQLVGRLRALSGAADRLEVVPRVLDALDEARAAGLGAVLDDLARRRVRPEDVTSELEFVWWASVLARVAEDDPGYTSHDGDRLREVATAYMEADRAHLRATALRVRASVTARLTDVAASHPDQVQLLRDEAARERGRRDLHELMSEAADVLTAVHPCWAMSPLVVASLLPPGGLFDVVVVDDGGRLPAARAISALARAGRVVVVGDPHGLPPAPFDTVVTQPPAADQESTPAEAPGRSLLEACSALLPTRVLERHYRSRDERLVSFVARPLRDGGPAGFPGTVGAEALRLHVLDEWPSGHDVPTLDALAAAAAREALAHARNHPGESLGVVTLGPGVDHAVESAVARELAATRDATDFFRHDRDERVFVKDAGLVQGDERDAVILVVGGRESSGAAVTVATTRARTRMTVIAPREAMEGPAADPGEEGTSPRRACDVSDFLRYAADPDTAMATLDGLPARGASTAVRAGDGTDGAADAIHPLVADLATRLRAEGLVVHEDHGRSGHRLDLAIEDPARPGRLLVAVESDGRARAAVRSTRDRERIFVEHLQRLGWRHLRIWTTDVFRDPARVVALVTAAVWEASRRAQGSRAGGD